MAWNREQIDSVALRSASADHAAFERIGMTEMEGARVLDVGCFDGFNTVLKLSPYGSVAQVVGIDPSAEAIALARNATDDGRFSWLQCRFEDFEPEGLFDVVYLAHTFQHLPDKGAAAAKARACLKPGGYVVIKTIDDGLKASWPDPEGIMGQVLALYDEQVRPAAPHTRHTDRYNGSKCYGLLRDAGFEDVSVDVRHASTAGLSLEERLSLFERVTYFRRPPADDAWAAEPMEGLLERWRALFARDDYFFDSPTFMVVGRNPGGAPAHGARGAALERGAFTFSPMIEADLGEVMAIEMRSFPDPWAPVAYAMELRHNPAASYWVARDGSGAVRGYIGWWEAPGDATITQVAVDAALRRQGLGRLLVQHACDQAAAQGVRRMGLTVRAGNQAARGFYGALGFREAGVVRGYYGSPEEDGIVMAVPLPLQASSTAEGPSGPAALEEGA